MTDNSLNPRNLFIATGIFHPESGGPATYLREILPALMDRGWDVRVLTFADHQHSDLKYPYPVTRVLRHALPSRLINYGSAARGFMQWADVAYLHSQGLPVFNNAPRMIPRVMKVVGDGAWERAVRKGWISPREDIDDFQTRSHDHLIVSANKTQRAQDVRRMQAIIVPSEYLARMVAGWGVDERRIYVIYNAVPPAPDLDMTQAEAKRTLNLPDAPILLFVGRLTPWKGVDHLIAAVSRANVPDLRLVVAGDGDQRAELEQLAHVRRITDRVTFLGNVPRERVAQYMRAADYLALYSGYEGLSHTILEALRAGTPVIASDKGGNPEVVRGGENGLLVPYVNIDALIAALETAYTPGVRDKLAANTGQGLERFDFDRMVAQTDALLREVRF